MIDPHSLNGVQVTFKNLKVQLQGCPIINDFSAQVPKGSSTAIIGPNGAGKTTLLMALLGQLPYQGTIEIKNGKTKKKPKIGYVPQKLQFDRGLPITVIEFMVMWKQRLPLWFGINADFRHSAMELLVAVKADNLASQKVGTLSGGEMQRVLLALSLWQDPDLLVLDEPAAGVDVHGDYIFCELLEELRHKRGFTQLMVTHDLSLITHHATHVICLNRKLIKEGPPKEVLTEDILMDLFGLHMGLVNRKALTHPLPNVTPCQCD